MGGSLREKDFGRRKKERVDCVGRKTRCGNIYGKERRNGKRGEREVGRNRRRGVWGEREREIKEIWGKQREGKSLEEEGINRWEYEKE